MTIVDTGASLSNAKTRIRRVFRRVVFGGNLGDLGRLPRYIGLVLLGFALIWLPIKGYLATAPLVYKSQASLILPGSGTSASVNLSGIGQASSYASSAFASNAVSPTETYKRLLNADRIIEAAAVSLAVSRQELGRPRVNLVDQTSLIHFEMTGGSPAEAKARAGAILTAFLSELDALRADEQQTRADSGSQAIQDFRASVARTRAEIDRLQLETGVFSMAQYDERLSHHNDLAVALRAQEAVVDNLSVTVQAMEAELGLSAQTAAITLKLFADEEYRQLLTQIALHASKVSDFEGQFGINHPQMVQAVSARTSAQDAARARAQSITGLPVHALVDLDIAPDGQRATLLAELVDRNANLAGETEQLDSLRAQFQLEKQQLDAMAGSAAQLQDLQRDFSVAEAVFASAIARSESTKSDVYASYPLVQVLENPSLPDRPSSPNRKLAFAAGLAATFMMLMGLALAWSRSLIIGAVLRRATVAQ